MAEDIVRTGIQIDIDTANAVSQLRALEQQISQFNARIVSSNDAMRTAMSANTKLLQQQIGDLGQFSTQIRSIQTDVGRFSTALEKGKLSFGEYFRYGLASTKTFGRAFTRELDLINSTAEDRVKRLSTRYVALGKEVNGMQKVLAIRPEILPEGVDTQLAMAAQRQQIFNQLLRQGSTHLVNWGKNTQWAGRQLMVGFTIPLTIFGGIASQVFMDLERQAINFRRVYGDAFTPAGETDAMLEEVKNLSVEFTKYGISASETMDMAAKAAATGAQGADLIAATTEATRLATLGQIDQQQALDATIALQSAFALNTTELAESVNFLNAVENQTVVSLNDVTQAIPRAATVIQGLGGNVQDLAAFLAAMRENGVNAAEGANALKSGLASLINPTKQAREQLEAVGINIDTIIETNRGDLMGTVQAFATAVNALDPLSRQQTLAQVFGKYQFARLGALFENITKDGSQASRVLQLMGDDVSNLAALADKELGTIEDAIGVKFQGAVERLKIAIAPIGEIFLRIATPVVEAATKVVEAFNSMPDAVKVAVSAVIAVLAGIAPVFLMGIGLIGNGIGNMIKGFDVLRGAYQRMTGKVTGATGPMSQAFGFMTDAELDAAAAANSLDGNLSGLTGTALMNKEAIEGLTGAYVRFAGAMNQAATARPQGVMATPRIRRMASGGFVGGRGNKDSEPALLMPGEFVVTKEATEKYAPILVAMNQGKLAGYEEGTPSRGIPRFLPERASAEDLQSNRALYEFGHAAGFAANELKTTVTSLSETADRIRTLGNNASEADLAFLDLLDTVLESERTFVRMEEAADGSWRATEVATKALKDLSAETGTASLGQFAGGRITSGTRNEALKQIGVDEPISFDNLRVAAEAAEQKLLAVASGAAEMQMPYQYALQAVIDEYNELRGDLQAQSRYLLDNAQSMIRDGLMTDRKMSAEQALAVSLEKRKDIEEMLIRTGAMLNGEIVDSTRAQQVVEAMLLRQADALAISVNPQVARRAAMSASSASGIGRVVQPRKPESTQKVFASPATRTSVAEALQKLGIEIGNDVNRYLVPSIEAGVSAGIDVGSPPPWSFQLGEWIAEGIQIGAKSQSERFATAYPSMPVRRMQPDPQIAANLQSMRPMGVAQPSLMAGAFEVDPQITKNLEEMGLSAGKAAISSEKDAVATNMEAAAHVENTAATNAESNAKKKGLGGFRGMLYALDGLSLAMSFLPGPLGEIANKVFIASAAFSALDAMLRIQIIDGALKRFGVALTAAAAASGLKAAGQGVASAVSTGADVATAAALARSAGPAGRVGGIFAKMLGPLSRITSIFGKLLPAIGRLVPALFRFVGIIVNGIPVVGQIISAILLVGTTIAAFGFAYKNAGDKVRDLGEAARVAGDDLKSIAEKFGFTERTSGFANQGTVLGRTEEARSVAEEARTFVQEDSGMQERVARVSGATDVSAEAIFRSMFMDLVAGGAPREVAVAIVEAVALEAGKQKAFVPVNADLQLTFDDQGKIKDIGTFISDSLNPSIENLQANLDNLGRQGFNQVVDTGAIDDAKRWMAAVDPLPEFLKETLVPQYKQKKAILETASSFELLKANAQSAMNMLSAQFVNGEIGLGKFNAGMDQVYNSLMSLPNNQGLQIMKDQLVALYPQSEATIQSIDDAKIAFDLLSLAAQGVNMSGFIQEMQNAGMSAAQVRAEINALMSAQAALTGAQSDVARIEAELAAEKAKPGPTKAKPTGSSGGTKDPFADREDELRDQQAKITIKEIKIDRTAEDRFDRELEERFGQTSITVGGIDIPLNSMRDAEFAIESIGEQVEDIERGPLQFWEDQIENINDEIKVYEDQLEVINRDIELQEQAISRIEEEYKPILDSLEEQKRAQEDILQGLEDQRDAATRPYEDQIALLERQLRVAEEAAKPRLDALEDEEKALDTQSGALDKQIDYIDEQKDALSEVAKMNEFIARQQKNRLNLTQALAEGDIYAATAAANQMKQDAADEAAEQQQNAFSAQQKSLEDQKKLIEDRKDAIEAERDAIQEGLDAIQNQIDAQEYQKFLIEDSYRLSIQAANDSLRATDREISRQTALRDARIKPYQDIIDTYAPQIDAINNSIYTKEQEIKKIEEERLIPLQDQITKLERQRDLLEDIRGDVEAEIARDKAALERRKQYLDQELQILSARREIADLSSGGGGGGAGGTEGTRDPERIKQLEAELAAAQQKLKDAQGQMPEQGVVPEGGMFDGAISAAQNAWTNFTTWFDENVVQPILDNPIVRAVAAVGVAVGQILTTAFGSAMEAVQGAWATFTSWFNTTIVEPIKAFFAPFGDFFVNTVLPPIRTAWETFKGWFNTTIITPIKNLWSSIVGWIQEKLIGPLETAWNNFVDWTKKPFNQMVEDVKKFFRDIPDNIAGFIASIPDKFADIIGDADKKTGILGKLVAIKDWFVDLPGTVVDAFAGIGTTIVNALKAGLNAIIDTWNGLKLEIGGFEVLGKQVGPWTLDTPNIPRLNAGGGVRGDGSRDSVSAMLTPGEFVVRKAMVDKYGTPMFEAINQGSFAMPKYDVAKSTSGNVDIKAQNTANIVAPMYNNYSVNVSVSNTNASADEIANKTIMKIKQMQNMQIRSGRG